MVVNTAMNALHLLFAALWVGSVLFVTIGILPFARSGEFNAAPLESVVSRLKIVSRTSVLVLLLTGGHLAGTGYTAETLFGSTRGHLVLAMVVLWFVLAALVEVGSGKLARGLGERKVREPAAQAWPFFLAASVVGVLLFVDAALITSPLAF
jgi:putative copper export protein